MQHSAECLSSPTTSWLAIRGLKMLMLLAQSLLIHIKQWKIAGLKRLIRAACRGRAGQTHDFTHKHDDILLETQKLTRSCKHVDAQMAGKEARRAELIYYWSLLLYFKILCCFIFAAFQSVYLGATNSKHSIEYTHINISHELWCSNCQISYFSHKLI